MKSKIFMIRKQAVDVDLVLLIIRIICGYAFILHGWLKIQHPMSWMGPGAAIPGIFQLLAAIAEFGGGIALVLGFLTRIGAFGIGCTMTVAVTLTGIILGNPFVSAIGGSSFELALVYFFIALLLMILGPGRFSLDRCLFGINKQ
jgi:putative oxidoreductase